MASAGDFPSSLLSWFRLTFSFPDKDGGGTPTRFGHFHLHSGPFLSCNLAPNISATARQWPRIGYVIAACSIYAKTLGG